jgi:hypothetical protein
MNNSFFAFAEALEGVPVWFQYVLDFRINKLAEELLEFAACPDWGEKKEEEFRDVFTCVARLLPIFGIENLNMAKNCSLADTGSKILKTRSLRELEKLERVDYWDELERHVKDMALTIANMGGYDMPKFYELALDKARKVAIEQGYEL